MKIEPITAFGVTMVNLDIDEVRVNIFAKRALCNVVFSAANGARFSRQTVNIERNCGHCTSWHLRGRENIGRVGAAEAYGLRP